MENQGLRPDFTEDTVAGAAAMLYAPSGSPHCSLPLVGGRCSPAQDYTFYFLYKWVCGRKHMTAC